MAYISAKRRNRIIIRTSATGIIANLLLAVFKALAGYFSGSIAVVLDAANSFTDMLSSIVTIVGVKVANKAPDRGHPMGHGRFEYLSSTFVAILIGYIGITAFIESFKKIVRPVPIEYSTISILIIIVSILTKLALGIYFKRVANKVESDSLKASGIDAMMDAIISASTLFAAIILIVFKISIEPYLALVISLFIVYAGIHMLLEAFSTIVGERIDPDLAHDIKQEICSIEGVYDANDLLIHDYGAHVNFASVNIEVLENLTALEIDSISREIRQRIAKKFRVHISSVGISPINVRTHRNINMQKKIRAILSMNDNILQVHGLYIDDKSKEINCDIVIDFRIKNRSAFKRRILDDLEQIFPEYKFVLTIDSDFSD